MASRAAEAPRASTESPQRRYLSRASVALPGADDLHELQEVLVWMRAHERLAVRDKRRHSGHADRAGLVVLGVDGVAVSPLFERGAQIVTVQVHGVRQLRQHVRRADIA